MYNMLTLAPSVHTEWNKGAFALKPLPERRSTEREKSSIRVQFFRQPYYDDQTSGKLKLTDEPKLADATFSGGAKMLWNRWRIESGRLVDDGEVKIQTGHVFTIKTTDPQGLPLPSQDLLESCTPLQFWWTRTYEGCRSLAHYVAFLDRDCG